MSMKTLGTAVIYNSKGYTFCEYTFSEPVNGYDAYSVYSLLCPD